ncbi:Hint domain-containing protein [Paracoccus marinaquae]|uniref:Hint domain-containing protein n=1 Tax=Paracoccus marinaquae TaxID=2841926 RepID=A0ABS6AI73_9RHOB|nr:Hint domain-containing protein [Paracoccus marinaquae]MBU3030302.1 Hint domain-containing protein [Paracoccus marinaquae]
MAFISELNFFGGSGAAGGEHVEIVLGPGEDPADFVVSAYTDTGALHTGAGGPTNPSGQVNLASLTGVPDPDHPTYTVYVIPLGFRIAASSPTEASGVALTNVDTDTVIAFYSGTRTGPVTATEGAASGATSEDIVGVGAGGGQSYQWDINDNLTIGPPTPGEAAVCLTGGCLVRTASGVKAAEELSPGDLVWTLDHSYQPIRWIGRRKLRQDELAADPRQCPILLQPSSFGPGRPERPLMLSPQHRVLVRARAAQRMYGDDEVLIAAKKLTAFLGIQPAEVAEVTYVHLLFDRHEVIETDGLLVESLLLAPVSKDLLSRAALVDEVGILPDPDRFPGAQVPCRPVADGKKGKQLLQRLQRNAKPLQPDADGDHALRRAD